MTISAFGNTVINLQLGRTVTIILLDKFTAGLSKLSSPPDVGDKVGNVKTRLQKLAAFTIFAYTVERRIETALCSVLCVHSAYLVECLVIITLLQESCF